VLAAVVAVIAWGVLTFGAVYPWAYWPLLCAAALCGLWLFFNARPSWPGRGEMAVFALIVVPPLLQTLSVPQPWIEAMAPKTVVFLRNFDLALSGAGTWNHPLSVNPAVTRHSLVFLAIGILWIAGLARAIHTGVIKGPMLIRAVMFVAVFVALEALAQKAMFNGKIYWFWESEFKVSSNHFGPFVNRNHFAGWMLLALGLGSGYLGGQITAGWRAKGGLREYLLWVGSPEASRILVTSAGLAVMAVSLVWTLSRSGVAAAAIALSVLAVAGLRTRAPRGRKIVVGAIIVLALGGAAMWRGLDTVAASYNDTRTLQWRFALWQDTVAPLNDFWRLGSGLNTYGTVMILYPQSDRSVHAQQAHNDYLQLAVEGGLLVVVPWLVAGMLIVWRIARRFGEPQDEMTWWIRMGAVASICGIAVQEISDFSLQIPGVALLFATCVALAVHEPAPVHARPRPSRKPLPARLTGLQTAAVDRL
jgi:O-antigen ligase